MTLKLYRVSACTVNPLAEGDRRPRSEHRPGPSAAGTGSSAAESASITATLASATTTWSSPAETVNRPMRAHRCRRLRKSRRLTRKLRTTVRKRHELPLARRRRAKPPHGTHGHTRHPERCATCSGHSAATWASRGRLSLRRHARSRRCAPTRPSAGPHSQRGPNRADPRGRPGRPGAAHRVRRGVVQPPSPRCTGRG